MSTTDRAARVREIAAEIERDPTAADLHGITITRRTRWLPDSGAIGAPPTHSADILRSVAGALLSDSNWDVVETVGGEALLIVHRESGAGRWRNGDAP